MIGRTGRAGHRGIATSFYTERDEPIASVLTLTLLETAQDIPDFLQQYVPEDNRLDFEPNQEEGTEEAGPGDDAWGAAVDSSTAQGAQDDAWVTAPEPSTAKAGDSWDAAPKATTAQAGNGWGGAAPEQTTAKAGDSRGATEW